MTTVSGAGYYNWDQLQFQRSPQNQSQLGITNSSAGVFTPSGTNSAGSTQAAASSACEDGKDDGSIGFWGALKNIGKGCVKFFTNMFTDENGDFSIGQTLKTLAIGAAIGAVCFLTAGTAVPAIIAAGGVAMSAYGLGKAAVNVATAKTDAEAEQAWQGVGSNSVALGLSIVGAKSVAKSMHAGADYSGWRGTANAVKDVFVDSGKAIGSNFEGVSSAQSLSANLSKIKANVGDNLTNVATTAKGNYYKAMASNAKTNYEQSLKDFQEALKKNDTEAMNKSFNDAFKYNDEYNTYANKSLNPTEPQMPQMPKWKDVTSAFKKFKNTPVKDLVSQARAKAGTIKGTVQESVQALHRQGIKTYKAQPQLLGTAAAYAA